MVAELKALKAQVPGASVDNSKEKKKAAAVAVVENKDEAKSNGLLQGDKVDLDRLEKTLLRSTYAAGHIAPSKLDATVYAALLRSSDNSVESWLASNGAERPNTARWVRHLSSYSAEEAAAWI